MPTLMRLILLAALCSPSASAGDAFVVTTPGKPGSGGLVPTLSGSGLGAAGEASALVLTNGLAFGTGTLVIGLTELAAPFKGGVLGPNPDILVTPISVSAAGSLYMPFNLPLAPLTGFTLWAQAWIMDPGASASISASNTLRFTTEPGGVGGRLFQLARHRVADSPADVVAEDFNGDGIVDLAVATRSGGGGLSVLMGAGDGLYCPHTEYPGVPVVLSMISDDFDADGNPDLAMVGTGGFAILAGDGEGGFSAPVLYQFIVGSERHIASGDLDADGYPDIVVAVTNQPTQPQMAVHLSNGDGTLGFPQFHATPTDTKWAEVADMTGDGVPDALVSGTSDISLLPGVGDGSLSAASVVAAPFSLDGFATGDLDGDGLLDVVASRSDRLQPLLGLGGGFLLPGPNYLTEFNLRPPVIKDLDEDGVLDMIVGGRPTSEDEFGVSVFRGLGDGTFAAPESYATGDPSSGLTVADLDSDGLIDAVTVHIDSNTGYANILRGVAPSEFEQPPTLDVSPFGPANPKDVELADLNGDAKLDLVIGSQLPWMQIALGNGDGTFEATEVISNDTACQSVAVSDLDGDGDADLIAAMPGPNEVWIVRGFGDGTFGPTQKHAAGDGPIDIEVGDVNLDGRKDVIVANELSGSVTVYLGQTFGTLGAPIETAAAGRPSAVAVGQLGGSIFPDFIVADSHGGKLYMREGQGDGTFVSPGPPLTIGDTPTAMELADLDADGELDCVVTCNLGGTGGEVRLFYGQGAFTFLAPIVYDLDNIPEDVDVVDVNADGLLDLVVGGFSLDHVSVLLNNGQTFVHDVVYGAISGPGAVAIGDIDSDGFMDIVTANLGSDNVTIMLSQLDP